MPVTVPEAVPTLAKPVAVLLHVPPVGVLVRVRVPPRHAAGVPLIAVGSAFTVAVTLALQPVDST